MQINTLKSSQTSTSNSFKSPLPILDGIFAFPPNRDTLGGTAYLIIEPTGNILLDCPAWNESNQQFLQEKGGVKWLFLTHRGAIGKNIPEMQNFLNFTVVIQEQEAYLLPEIQLTTFSQDIQLNNHCQGIWTPGFSPGSSCLYCSTQGGILFSGRHLLPNQQGHPLPLRIAKTFHWLRQLGSVQKIRDRFNEQTLHYLCPGANTGFLRGKGIISSVYPYLAQLDLDSLQQVEII
jgi:glyoxylase-like metal-dependent hydrolase (beta-lactamase superfamily II)